MHAQMVGGVDRVRVLPKMPTQMNLAAILNLKPSHAALVQSYMHDIENPCYGQLTAVKTKVSADQYHVTISPAQVLGSSRSLVFLS